MYKLPQLNYLYDGLEPFIDTHTLGFHYNIHEYNYLKNLIILLNKNNYDYRYSLEELIYHIDEFNSNDREDILYNLGGVLNHNLYFHSMNTSERRTKMMGNLLMKVERKYGSYEGFYEEFKKSALKSKGSGYTFLVMDRRGDIDIINTSNQDTPLVMGYIPLFTIDMWEHAYYINYGPNKSEYLDNFKRVADFSLANKIYNEKKILVFFD